MPISPTNADIGRSVVYRPRHGEPEQGVITSYNFSGVFVRYDADAASKLTSRADLEWAAPARVAAGATP